MIADVSYTHKDDIEIVDNKVLISLVTIDKTSNPVKPLNLLFDTGAFITLIGKQLADNNDYQVINEKGCVISGFSEKGLVCDLRRIPTIVFCGFRIDDVWIATPHDEGVDVTEVIGMNILENFNFGLDFSKEEIYLNARQNHISQKPKYQCGNVSVFHDLTDIQQ